MSLEFQKREMRRVKTEVSLGQRGLNYLRRKIRRVVKGEIGLKEKKGGAEMSLETKLQRVTQGEI
jgi:hypothetical protein